MNKRYLMMGLILGAAIALSSVSVFGESWECELLKPEREILTDPGSGAELVFITRSPAEDTNLYFHQRSWLPDGSMVFFCTNRNGRTELFGYLESTGELVRLERSNVSPIAHSTAGRLQNHLYFTRDKAVYEWAFDITKPEDEQSPSRVKVSERLIADLPDEMSGSLGINDTCDGRAIVVGFRCGGPDKCRILWIDKQFGVSREIARTDHTITHIQASWTKPDLVMFASEYNDRAGEVPEGTIHSRMMMADLSDREPWPIYPQVSGELVTHECFWVGDQVTFCSGIERKENAEEAHVKALDLSTGQSRIIGAGCWWDGGTAFDISKLNWWHASGAPNGRWVAGDNWHGDIAIFSARTSRKRLLTDNHRIYGKGAHPHVGWNPSGDKVIFTSNKFGNPDVVIGSIPKTWRNEDW
ncbi:MAG: hypothetical protein ABIH23_14280 [bacterium]